MNLTVLGAHGTWPLAGGATSGYLVREDGFSLWMDCGSGTMANLQKHIGMFDVDAVAISHVHPDHLVDLYAYFFARVYSPEKPKRATLFTPPGLLETFVVMLQDGAMEEMRSTFDLVTVEPGTPFEAGPFRVSTRPMAHPVPTLGMRIESDGAALAYTADTGPTEELRPLAAGADLLLAEATWQDDHEETAPIHLTAKQAGDVAGASDVPNLVLTHLRPHLDWDRSREEASSRFDGEVRLAEENASIEVGR